MKLQISILFLLFVQAYANQDKLFRIHVKNEKDAEVIHNFMLNNSENVDLWSGPKANSKVLAQFKGETLKEFQALGVHFEVANDNITKLFERSIEHEKKQEILRKKFFFTLSNEKLVDNFNLDEYHSYDEVVEYLKSVQKKSSSTIGVRFSTIGQTYENRDIHALTISKEALKEKKIFLLECGVHAREWVSVAGCLKIIDRFIVHRDEVANQILNKYDVHILPLLNPDGYEYTRNHDRAWRKNRGKNRRLPICRGTDINRNFDVAWGTVGVDKRNPCSLIYCGSGPFSENESKALRDYAISIKNSLEVYISLHSFSQLLLYPYGHKAEVPKNQKNLQHLATLAMDAIYSKQGEIYKGGNIYTAIYPASGSTVDWIAMNTASKYNWAFEMRDTGEHGFVLPEELIDPAFMDIWIGMEQLLLNPE